MLFNQKSESKTLTHTHNIAIKTSSGMTQGFYIGKKVMQGTVWAGLMCTCTMDKLGKLAYND